ncbi:hypothetical protein V6N13_125372 [Hibiscus sabdariffa]
MAMEDGEWRWNLFQHILLQSMLLRIATIKGPSVAIAEDVIGWIGSHMYQFALREAYMARARLPFGPHDMVLSTIQQFRGIQRIKPIEGHPSIFERSRHLQATMLRALVRPTTATVAGTDAHQLQVRWSAPVHG